MQNSNIKTFLFGIYFILSLAPIGIETSSLLNKLEDIKSIFNLFRLIIPVFLFLSLSFFIKKLNLLKFRTIFFILIYFIVIFITTILNLQNSNEIHKLLLPFYCINYIFLILLVLNTNDLKKKFNNFIFLQFIIITTLATFSLFQFFSSFVNLNLSDLYNLKVENNFYNQNSNGLSRILLVISLFILLMNKKNKYLYLSCIIINTIIIILQSKLVLFFLCLFFFIKFFFSKEKIKEKIQEILVTIIIPLLITFFLSAINTINHSSKMRLIVEVKEDISKEYLDKTLDLKILKGFKTRIEAWKEILNNSKKPLFGHGSQADKYLTNNLPKHTQLASNSFIYAYACAGLIGIVSLAIIYYKVIQLLLRKTFFNKTRNKFNNLQLFYITVLCFLMLRSIVENSFALWGLDFILLINCYFGLKNISFKKKLI